MRQVIDTLLENLQEVIPSRVSAGKEHWQLHAASAVTVMSEVLYGASQHFSLDMGGLSGLKSENNSTDEQQV